MEISENAYFLTKRMRKGRKVLTVISFVNDKRSHRYRLFDALNEIAFCPLSVIYLSKWYFTCGFKIDGNALPIDI